jgi:DNA-binding XRE family transcriptional regulator
MTVLEIIAEQLLGARRLATRPRLRKALRQIDTIVNRQNTTDDEKARIASIVELCFAYERETDREEKANILRTLEEVSENEALELPIESIEDWDETLKSEDSEFAKARKTLDARRHKFQRKYFSLRAKAGLRTQREVAQKAGLRRSYVAVIESSAHLPQQKTLQKLAKAFGVDVAELLI